MEDQKYKIKNMGIKLLWLGVTIIIALPNITNVFPFPNLIGGLTMTAGLILFIFEK